MSALAFPRAGLVRPAAPGPLECHDWCSKAGQAIDPVEHSCYSAGRHLATERADAEVSLQGRTGPDGYPARVVLISGALDLDLTRREALELAAMLTDAASHLAGDPTARKDT